jgi:hypothetical protein
MGYTYGIMANIIKEYFFRIKDMVMVNYIVVDNYYIKEYGKWE